MAGYSELVLLHAESPLNVGWLEDANAIASVGGPGRPPFMAMYLRIEVDRVVAARYRTFGCAPAIAAGSILTEMITNRRVPECLAITQANLADALGGLPKDKRWCASLAITAMRNALADCTARKRPDGSGQEQEISDKKELA